MGTRGLQWERAKGSSVNGLRNNATVERHENRTKGERLAETIITCITNVRVGVQAQAISS